MKKIIASILILFATSMAYSQITQEMYDKKVEEIALLKKQLEDVGINQNDVVVNLQSSIKSLQESNSELRSKLTSLEEFKSQKKEIEDRIAAKDNKINILENQLKEKDRQIEQKEKESTQKAKLEYERGKSDALATVLNFYKNHQLDDLIKSSTLESVARDIQFVGNYPEAKQVLNELQIYFNTKRLLSEKFDANQIENVKMQLDKIKTKSSLLIVLKEEVDFYQDFNDAFKKTIVKIITLDNDKWADGDAGIQKEKFTDIVTILADYIYNYYDYNNYPYLSDLLLEIIKRKKLNADADISDLLKKLE